MFYSYGSLYSQAAASQAQTDASDAQANAREAKTEAELLRHDVDRLLMITEALWTLLKKEHGYSDEQLADTVKEIDLRDGRLDGKVAKAPPQPCPKCGRVNSGKQSLCIYCGAALPVTLFAADVFISTACCRSVFLLRSNLNPVHQFIAKVEQKRA